MSKKFFDTVRKTYGALNSKQVEGFNAVLEATDGLPTSWRAYILATAWHETNQTMQPVVEAYWLSEAWRKKNLRYYPWHGRGYVQLTWEENYKEMDRELKLNGALIKNPDKALEPDIAAKILVVGMTKGKYDKQGRGLKVFLPCDVADLEQFRQARRTVNLMDKATEIANVALTFQKALF